MIHIGIPSGIWQTIAASNFTFHKAPSPRTASTSIAYGQGEVSAAWGARRGEPSLLLVRSASQRIWEWFIRWTFRFNPGWPDVAWRPHNKQSLGCNRRALDALSKLPKKQGHHQPTDGSTC
jgi:hypothetical protein